MILATVVVNVVGFMVVAVALALLVCFDVADAAVVVGFSVVVAVVVGVVVDAVVVFVVVVLVEEFFCCQQLQHGVFEE